MSSSIDRVLKSRLSRAPGWWRCVALGLLACAGCGDADPSPAISANVCRADAPRFRGLCVVTADEIHFQQVGPARTFTVVRTVNSIAKSSFEKIPADQGLYKFHLDPREPFAKYSLFFAGTPGLSLEFYHGARIKPLTPKPTGTDDEDALWWVSDDGSKATRMTYRGVGSLAETYDLKTFAQVGSYKVDTEKLFPYGKHMLLRYSTDRNKVEQFFPETNTSVTFLEAAAPIHSFWRQGNQFAIQTEDGTISLSGQGFTNVFPMLYIAYADNQGVIGWQKSGAGCGLSLIRYDWAAVPQTLATKSGLCDPLHGFAFLGNTLFGVVLRGDGDDGVYFGTRDLEASWNFKGSMVYTDDSIGVAKTTRLEYAYANGTVLANQGLLECAAGARDMNPNAGISLFYETGTVLVDDVPEHLSELTTHQNIKTCYGY